MNLREHLVVPCGAACPRVLLIISPCRCGSTALERAFAGAGLPVYHQPLKTVVRHHLVGEKLTWVMPTAAEAELVVVKETFGPYAPEENELDPVGTLVDAGCAVDRLSVLAVVRDPGAAYASWQRWWPDSTLDAFVAAFKNCRRRVTEAHHRGVRVRCAVLEQATADAREFLRALFAALAVPFHDHAVDWRASGDEVRFRRMPNTGGRIPTLGASRIVMPAQPERFGGTTLQHLIHDELNHAASFEVRARAAVDVPDAVVDHLRAQGLYDDYDTFRGNAERDLAIKAPPLVL